MDYFKTVNIERGMPRVETAKRILNDQITMAKKTGVRVLKIIHGYGSSGKGGALRTELREMLKGMENRLTVINGEDFSIFNERTRQALQLFPELRRDRDLENANRGVTLIIIK